MGESSLLLWLMVIAQGMVGYGLTSVMGAIPAEKFGSCNFGVIFGTVITAAIAGGAVGPWLAGISHDLTGSYRFAFLISIFCSGFSAAAIWQGRPLKPQKRDDTGDDSSRARGVARNAIIDRRRLQ